MKNSIVTEVQKAIADLDELIALKNEQGADVSAQIERRNEYNERLAQAYKQHETELNNVAVYELPKNFIGYIYSPFPKYKNWANQAIEQLQGSLIELQNAKTELAENGFSTVSVENAIEQTALNIEELKNEVTRFNYIQEQVNNLNTEGSGRGRKKGSKNIKKVVTPEMVVETPENVVETSAAVAVEDDTEAEFPLVVSESKVMVPKKVWSAPEEPEPETEAVSGPAKPKGKTGGKKKK